MQTYEELKKNARKFVSLTSLTPEELEYVLPAFEQAYRQVFPDTKTKTGQKRERKNLVEVEKAPLRASNKNCCLH